MKTTITLRRVVAFVSLAAIATVLSACNTVKGVGTDLTEASDKTKEVINK
jgi:predicted small secreted protein